MKSITSSNFTFPKQKSKYIGKVREVYSLENGLLVMVVTDRLSAFDIVMPKGIPFKGQILNQIAVQMMEATADIVPSWLTATPDPNVTVGQMCDPFKVEMVIRGYISGHAAREYKLGKRILCGVDMPEGMIENNPFPQPIITPATKVENGHDEDISREDIIAKGIVNEKDYLQLEKYTRSLFQRGTEIAQKRGLILVDTKYEFGKTTDGKIVLIDEIHTPDSSRYFYIDTYKTDFDNGVTPKQLSKEFFRQWFIKNNFQGKENQNLPEISDEIIDEVSERYIELFNIITGNNFKPRVSTNVLEDLEKNILNYIT